MILFFFLLGLAVLILGAELLVRGASRLAVSFGISPLVVGLTVVAFGTSSPELAVSVQSTWSGQADIALGNVIGSNIFNILFIVGLSALITPLIVNRQLVRQEVPLMIGVSLLTWGLAWDGALSFLDGALLSGLLAVYCVFLIRQSRRAQSFDLANANASPLDLPDDSTWDRHWAVQLGLIAAGLILLVLGSRWLVEGAIAFATWMGVSELVIGLTIVAAGTSLPEVATSVLAALRGQRDIAVGNAVGSNIFNLLCVLGISALVAPTALPVSTGMLSFDLPIMIAVAVACLPIFFTGYVIARWEGLLFLAYYVAYTAWLFLHATDHGAQALFGTVMIGFVLPLTFVTLAVLSYRHWQGSRRPGNT
ncbi:calcium/sodium antiporter [Thiocystis violascens]|uniref:K+dependent Na+ exchanger related-protein n=1 Tax=Thiocystis violascens (strain ATCC 17096 / DSM 198 / 6111) TaxID=765911 RepID=I3Y5A8_THIV6|nr:calcium/sodium antiporter [Thiocystis violascens]AFL72176.1 K+dependent Na+ exchanger related-protein [Thiocystis violascens DSM 198]